MSGILKKIAPVELSDLEQYRQKLAKNEAKVKDITTVSDVYVELIVKLGKKDMTLGDVRRLSVGDILEVDKKPGHKVDIYFAEQHAGIGEVVLGEENFGIVISDIFEHQQFQNSSELK